MFSSPLKYKLDSDPTKLASRVKGKISKLDFFLLALSFGFMIMFFNLQKQEMLVYLHDYRLFIGAANGDPTGYFYPYWLFPLFKLFDLFSYDVGLIIWNIVNILGIWLITKLFGGNRIAVLTSYQMYYCIVYGQIVGIMLLGIGWFWYFANKDKWTLAGAGLLLGAAKYQSGLIICFLIWLYVEGSWKDKLRALILPAAIAILSLILYPNWPLEVLERTQTAELNTHGNISAWQWIGPYTLLILIPLLILPTNRETRLITLISALPLIMPYYQQTDLLTIFVFPINWQFIMLGNLAYLMPIWGWSAVKLTLILPISLTIYHLTLSIKERISVAANAPSETLSPPPPG